MNTSNKKRITLFAYFSIFSILLCFASIFTIPNYYLDAFIFLLATMFFILLLRVRVTEVDGSGYCLTIRRKGIFCKKGYHTPMIEFPLSDVKEMTVKKGLISSRIYFKTVGQSRTRVFQVNLLFYNKKQVLKIHDIMRSGFA